MEKKVLKKAVALFLAFIIMVFSPSGAMYAYGTAKQLNSQFSLNNSISTGTREHEPVIEELEIVDAAGGMYHTLILTDDGSVWTLGSNSCGQLGYKPAGFNMNNPRPERVSGLNNIEKISADGYTSYAIDREGTVWKWGWGVGDFSDADIVQFDCPGEGKMIASSHHTEFVLLTDGTLWLNEPIHEDRGFFYITDNVKMIPPTDYHDMSTGIIDILKNDGSIWRIHYYPNDTYPDYSVEPFIENEDVIMIGNGIMQSMALRSDGTVFTYSENGMRDEIFELSDVTEIAVSGFESVALKSDGTVWRFDNTYFQDSSYVNLEQVPLYGVAAVRRLGESSIAICEDGTVWGWGANQYGQIGQEINYNIIDPVLVTSSSGYNPELPPLELPNNSGKLRWPVDSYEVTLWFGSVDEQYTVKNKGLNIQGEVNSNVFSVCDGIVSFKGYSPLYGNIIYVNYNYNGKPMQVRYGHLTNPSSLNVGDRVYKGNVIGKMAKDSEINKGVIEIVFCKSTDGKVCKNTGENVEFVEPTNYIEKKPAYSEYLSEPFATLLDTTGLAMSEVTPNIIMQNNDDAYYNRRYKKDLDLEPNEGYLKKLLIEFGTEIGKTYTEEALDKENVIKYAEQYNIALVNMNSRTKWYGPTYGNGVMKNRRMVVDKEKLWDDLIGQRWYYPEGGTWTASTVPNIFAYVRQQIYIPNEVADNLYLITEGDQVSQEILDVAEEFIVGLGAEAATKLLNLLLVRYGLTIPKGYLGCIASGIVLYCNILEAIERENFRNACLQCGEGEYVRISSMVIRNVGIVNTYEVASEIKDVYRSKGTFQRGYYSGF